MKLYYLLYKVTIASTFDAKLTRQDLLMLSCNCENMRVWKVTESQSG